MEDDRLVTLVSSEGEEFVVKRKEAEVSHVIKVSLESAMKEGREQRVRFDNISAPVLRVVVDYLRYKVEHANARAPIPEFKIDDGLLIEVLQAAHYLDA